MEGFRECLARRLPIMRTIMALSHHPYLKVECIWMTSQPCTLCNGLSGEAEKRLSRCQPRLRTHSQKMTVAARQIAEKNTVGHLS